MIKVLKNTEKLNTSGTSLGGYLSTNYEDLIKLLGQPTWDEPSGDDKVQIEWVIEFKGNIFTIYDWKTYNREYTMKYLTVWNVGSKVNADEFITHIQTLLDKK